MVDQPQGTESEDEYMTLTEAARKTGLHPTTLRNQYYKGKLRAQLRGRDLWVRWSEIQRYLRERKREGSYRDDVQAEPPSDDPQHA